jgi:putative DNA primase/helicase
MSAAAFSLRALARALGGEVAGAQVLAPGPGHGPRDRSLSVRPSAIDPDGFVTHSFAGDDFRDCRAHVLARLGLTAAPYRRDRQAPKHRPARGAPPSDDQAKAAARFAGTRQALVLWGEAVDPRGTLVERYLNNRALDLSDDLAGDVLRWHTRIGAMLALFRGIHDGQPQAISRTFLDAEGRKIERKFLGPVTGAAIMLDPFDDVLTGLHVGEGIETCMTARQFEHQRPCWVLGSSGGLKATGEPYGGIAAFPVLGGIECLTILAENDERGTSARAVEACAARCHAAGREVIINEPIVGKDLNDAVRLRSAP